MRPEFARPTRPLVISYSLCDEACTGAVYNSPLQNFGLNYVSYRKFDDQEQSLLEEIMHLRRDVRGNRFLPKPLAESDLQRILNAGLMAPSVGFSQPWRFVVVRSAETKAQIADIFQAENNKARSLFKARKGPDYQQLKLEGITESAVNIAVFYEHSKAPILGQTSMSKVGEYSTVCAIQNMWLMARAMNIGLGWVSILDSEKVGSVLNAQANQELIAYLCIGHVDTFYDRPELETLGWETRKQMAQVVFEEQFESAKDEA